VTLPRESATEPEVCPNCGYMDTRDAFEGWERVGDATSFRVRCPKCEAMHPDQSDHDAEAATF
jgi:hypothetical protein